MVIYLVKDKISHGEKYSGMILMEKLKEAKVEGIITYPGHPHEKYKNSTDYLIDRLKPKDK